ncbi:response regulator [Altererythrobacter sp. MF3-039]|uniref:response regulator n=1 Tax=Altererythrobacter sp. MF3-039 TaxID=3252901 RepID=UPI00390CABE2
MANILIADDDPIISELACGLLIADGHACGWVSDGEKALETIRWRRPDLLLLDQHMPGKSGSDLLRELRGSPDHYDLPIVMFTGVTGREDELQARYHGAQDYIRKPFDAERLLFTVNEVLGARANRPKHMPLPRYFELATGLCLPEQEKSRSLA